MKIKNIAAICKKNNTPLFMSGTPKAAALFNTSATARRLIR